MNKKGGYYKPIIYGILFLAGAILVFILLGKINLTLFAPIAAKTPCEIALWTTHVKANVPGWTADPEHLKEICSTKKRNADLIFKKETNAKDMNEKIAKALFDCIKLMGGGYTNIAESNWFEGEKKCFICSTITFKDKALEIYKESNKKAKTTSFHDWLENNKIKERQTFKQFFDEYFSESVRGTREIALVFDWLVDPNYKYTIYVIKDELGSVQSGLAELEKLPVLGDSIEGWRQLIHGEGREEIMEKLRASIVMAPEVALSECTGGVVN